MACTLVEARRSRRGPTAARESPAHRSGACVCSRNALGKRIEGQRKHRGVRRGPGQLVESDQVVPDSAGQVIWLVDLANPSEPYEIVGPAEWDRHPLPDPRPEGLSRVWADSPAWSPDGREVYFWTNRNGGSLGQGEVWKVNLETEETSVVLPLRKGTTSGEPSAMETWSPAPRAGPSSTIRTVAHAAASRSRARFTGAPVTPAWPWNFLRTLVPLHSRPVARGQRSSGEVLHRRLRLVGGRAATGRGRGHHTCLAQRAERLLPASHLRRSRESVRLRADPASSRACLGLRHGCELAWFLPYPCGAFVRSERGDVRLSRRKRLSQEAQASLRH